MTTKTPVILSIPELEKYHRSCHYRKTRMLCFAFAITVTSVMIPIFEPHILHEITVDTLREIAFVPIWKIIEDLF